MSSHLSQLPLFVHVRQVWRRRQRLIWLAFSVPIAAAISLAWFLPRHYRSTALVVVERGAGIDDDDVDGRLNLIRNENLRRARLRALITGYNLYTELGRHVSAEALVDQMQKDIHIDADKEERGGRSVAVAMRVTYTGSDPRVTADVANELAAFFEREDLRIREERANYGRKRLRSQLTDAREALDEQANRLKDYKMKHLNELPEQVGLHLAALEQLHSQIRVSQGEPERSKPRSSGGGAPSNATPAEHDERLDRLHELETRFTADHPDVKRLKREIAMAPFAAKRVAPEAQPGTISIEEAEASIEANNKAKLENIARRAESLRQTASIHEQGILNAPFRQQELEALLPDYTAARARYQTLAEKYEIAAVSDPRHEGGGFRVLDPAVARNQPISPNVPRVVAVGVGLALAASAAVVFAAEKIDTTFHTLADVRAFTRVPVLASLPRLASKSERRREARGNRDFAAVVALIVACILIAVAFVSRGNPGLVMWIASSRG